MQNELFKSDELCVTSELDAVTDVRQISRCILSVCSLISSSFSVEAAVKRLAGDSRFCWDVWPLAGHWKWEWDCRMQRQYLRAAPRGAKYSSKKSPWACKTLSPFVVITTYRVVLPTPERRAGRQGSPPPAATSSRALRRRSARPGPAPFAERGASSPWRPPLPGPAAPLSSAPPIRPRRRCRSAPRKPRPADRYQVGFSPISCRRTVFG